MKFLTSLLTVAAPPVDKDEWIRRHVAGATFADIGGLWGTVNEKVSVAVQAGAASATMIDVQPLDAKWWRLFHDRCSELNVSGYRSVQGDICEYNAVRKLGRFDMVHCSGILYHVPDLFNFLRNLFQVTRRHLILTSMVVPAEIRNRHGRLSFPDGACYSVPLLAERERRILTRYFDEHEIEIKGINAEAPRYMTVRHRFRTGPWWWLFTAATLKKMMQMFPVEILDEGYSWQRKSYSLLLAITDRPADEPPA